MKRYIKIYQALIKINFRLFLEDRTMVINSFISSLTWATFQIITVLLLTYRASSAYGWSRGELLLLASSYNLFVGIFHLFFSSNFEKLADTIEYGRLDSVLVKPIDSQFLVTTTYIRYNQVVRFILGIAFNYYIIITFHITFSFVSALTYLFLMIVGVMLLYSLWLFFSTLLIWYTNLTNLTDLLFQMSAFSRYPMEMYQKLQTFIFLVFIPYALMLSIPTKAFLQKATIQEIMLLFAITIIALFISRKFWQFALRYYTSASG